MDEEDERIFRELLFAFFFFTSFLYIYLNTCSFDVQTKYAQFFVRTLPKLMCTGDCKQIEAMQ